jgi:MoxR-like ATPase
VTKSNRTGAAVPSRTDHEAVPATPDQAVWFGERHDRLLRNIGRVVKGKSDVIRLALTCVFSEGHLLIEDVPGVGKTSIAKALAGSLDATWHRIQFTPDLLPSDLTGVQVWDQQRRVFEFRKGAVFANVVVGDEINRASPKTQSALLEVMEEQQVTVDSIPHLVPRPFVVIATQNPIDLDGTYRLPEAQMDRFLMRTSVGYPDADAEVEILGDRTAAGGEVRTVGPVLSLEDAQAMISLAARNYVAPALQRYVVELVTATRSLPDLRLGVSPRGSLALQRAAQAWAAGEGRSYVTPEDVKALAVPVLGHRMVLTPEAELSGRRVEDLLAGVLASTPVPQR